MREVLFPKANFRPNACVAEINNLTDSCRDFEREFEWADSAGQQSSTTPVMGENLGRGRNPTSADSFEKRGKRVGRSRNDVVRPGLDHRQDKLNLQLEQAARAESYGGEKFVSASQFDSQLFPESHGVARAV
uniref:Uncharacterized protein n=1 Tax=Salix viminalis TaxID=40686 RepID=A0A6N2MTH4_SALVM